MAKRTNNDLQNITHKTKNRVTRTPLKIGDDLRCSGSVGVHPPRAAPVVLDISSTPKMCR
jgi:hypothetical protein